MRVVVTRPENEGGAWVDGLRARGLDAVALPLIAIGGTADAAAVRAAWSRLARYRAVMFVSANAVAHFCAARPAGPDGPAAWPADTRAWAPGPGTARALRDAGIDARRIDTPEADAAQFDSEALWQAAGAGVDAGDEVLIVRGENPGEPAAPSPPGAQAPPGHGREWMAKRLEAARVAVDHVVAYRRGPPEWNAEETAFAASLARPATTWVFSNSEAIGHLLRLLPAGGRLLEGAAVATHPRIATAAREAGFAWVADARPTLESVAMALDAAGRRPAAGA
ncbi:MAG: uroporphyrinogen-III synthase [Pseudomonadota bacterium]